MYTAFRRDLNHAELIEYINKSFGLCVDIYDIITY